MKTSRATVCRRNTVVGSMPAHRKLSAILSADVVGYSRLMADDERATIATLSAYRDLFRERVERHEGRVVDSPGDAILAQFPSAVEAVDCAQEVQRRLEKRNAQLAEHRHMVFRIGISLGDVIEEDGRLYGDEVNIASRLEALAEPGAMCVSGAVYDQIEGKLPLRFEFAGEQTVKNIRKAVRVYHWVRARVPAAVHRTLGKPFFASALNFLLLCAVIAAWWWSTSSSDIPQMPVRTGQNHTSSHGANGTPRLAVLPFTNISSSAEDEYFADGMTEELISRLSRVHGLDTIARTSTMQYKGKFTGIAEIGRDLKVGTVLEGSVRKAGDKVRITVQLIDVGTQGYLWSEDYDRNLSDILEIQSEIAARVTNALHIRLAGPTALRIAGKDSSDLATYTNRMTPDGLKKSIEYF